MRDRATREFLALHRAYRLGDRNAVQQRARAVLSVAREWQRQDIQSAAEGVVDGVAYGVPDVTLTAAVQALAIAVALAR